jgi:hypothetical protein
MMGVSADADAMHAVVDSRSGRADIGELPFEVLLQRLKALEGDLELVGRVEGCRVVPHGDVEQAHCC